ncbi:hypothetical protein [Dryocola sp. BD586]|uniref:hypothetical protein n=1 Tax=Dryocola sp. BD586 TaxID=3133271 RepID=UPI003F4FD3AD
MSSGQTNNGWATFFGALTGALAAISGGTLAAYITSNQAAESADKAAAIQIRSLCIQSIASQEQNLRSNAAIFLGSLGAFRNLVAHPHLYKNEDFTKNMDSIVVNGLQTSAYTSTALSDITIKLSESVRKISEEGNISNEDATIKANSFNHFSEAWLKQYRLDLEELKKERELCNETS